MRSIPNRLYLLVLVSSFLQFAAFPIAGPVPVWREALCWIALIPFLYALVQTDVSGHPLTIPRAAALGYLCGTAWYIGNCYWIYQTMYLYGGLPKLIALAILLLFSLYLGLYHCLFAISLVLVRRSRLGINGALCSVPFLWVAVELARARITGFPWDLLGYAQVDQLVLTRLAPFAGVLGLSFVIAAVNAGLTIGFFSRRGRWMAFPATASAITLLMIITRSTSFPAARAGELNYQVAIMMQENLSVGAVGREAEPLTQAQEYQQFSEWSLRPYSLLKANERPLQVLTTELRPSVIIWPEAPSHFQSVDPNFQLKMGYLARAAGAPIVAGSLGIDFSKASSRGYFLYDSATLFDRGGKLQGRYDKIHLVPWGEYIPFKEVFAFASKLTEGVGDMDRGHDRSVFNTDGHSFGVFVCYESIFGDEVRQFVRNGAQVLVNISDDGWYGDTGAPWQHLNMARMRAMENHRWVLRSTNTGITTAINPLGGMAVQAPRHVRAAYAFRFGYNNDITFYTRHGDWLGYLCAGISLALLLFSLRTK